jgi:hypothetical protein
MRPRRVSRKREPSGSLTTTVYARPKAGASGWRSNGVQFSSSIIAPRSIAADRTVSRSNKPTAINPLNPISMHTPRITSGTASFPIRRRIQASRAGRPAPRRTR